MSIIKDNDIKIVNLILTRKCNLSCNYCRLSGNLSYENSPYPDKEYFYENELDYNEWKDIIRYFNTRNENTFFILVGGEPLFYKNLYKIVNYLNYINAPYTIISNCSEQVIPLIDDLLNKCGKLKGFTASVDPIIDSSDKSIIHKTNNGFKVLKWLKDKDLVDDIVAEVTVDNDNIKYLIETVKILDNNGITTDITTLDICKSKNYDFSNIRDYSRAVQKSPETFEIFKSLINSNFKIHMKDQLLPVIYSKLPCTMRCNIKIGNINNITIDSDGAVRLCYRIRGVDSVKNSYKDIIRVNLNGSVEAGLISDYKKLCRGCIWTCMMMSNLPSENIINH